MHCRYVVLFVLTLSGSVVCVRERIEMEGSQLEIRVVK